MSVSLKLTSRINLGKRGANFLLSTQPISPPQSGKDYFQVKKDPKFAQQLLITPSELQKRPQMAIKDYV